VDLLRAETDSEGGTGLTARLGGMGWFPPGFWAWFFALPWPGFFTVLNGFLLIAIAVVVGYYGWRHTRNAVVPLLEFTLDAPIDKRRENPTVSLELVNKGLGPAIVTSFELYVRDELMVTSDNLPDWGKILAKLNIPAEVSATARTQVQDGVHLRLTKD